MIAGSAGSVTFPTGAPPASAASVTDLLAVSGLGKSIGRRRVLDGVTFSVRPGEVLGLVGPKGAGKTTLLGCLAGLLPTQAGRVTDGMGKDLSPAVRRKLLFYLPDGILPWPEQSLDRLLGLWSHLWRVPEAREEALVERLELWRFRDLKAGSLSKGERERMLLALGLMSPRPLLLLDEPFDGLDLGQAREVAKLLKEAAAEGRTLLLSLHEMGDAGRVCDRIVILDRGRVAGVENIDHLRERPGFARGSLNEGVLAPT